MMVLISICSMTQARFGWDRWPPAVRPRSRTASVSSAEPDRAQQRQEMILRCGWPSPSSLLLAAPRRSTCRPTIKADWTRACKRAEAGRSTRRVGGRRTRTAAVLTAPPSSVRACAGSPPFRGEPAVRGAARHETPTGLVEDAADSTPQGARRQPSTAPAGSIFCRR
jgi:hypothetical protein